MKKRTEKITVRLDPKEKENLDDIIEERKEIDSKINPSKFVRELIANYKSPDMMSLIDLAVKYAIHNNIPLGDLKGTVGTLYKIYQKEYQAPIDPK